MRRTIVLLTTGCLAMFQATAQEKKPLRNSDSLQHQYMPEVTVVGRGSSNDIHQLPEIVGTSIFAGKKNALIVMDNLAANVVTNNMRQVMAKVPGIHVWESDGSGIQIGIASRGLSPNRSWEFNMRQNGYDIAADPFGYPEAYYTPQLQSVQRIQIVKGSGALQYGPQFGGLVNFVLRNGSEINKPFEFETNQTIGSFGLFNSYNAIGGKGKKFNYYVFADHRGANGWRQNSRYEVNTGYGSFTYKPTERLQISAEWMLYKMRSQQPGGLTDSLFAIDAQKSYRSRNWFEVPWSTAALNVSYTLKNGAMLEAKIFKLWGNRKSNGYLRAINIADSINALTKQYNPRTIDMDEYRNYGAEIRYRTDYRLLGVKHTISTGIRLFKGDTRRLKNGLGDTGSDFNTDLQQAAFPMDLALVSDNFAAFAENVFRVTDKFILIPGIRFEHLSTEATGRLKFNSNGTEDLIGRENRSRNFVLMGIGAEYHTSPYTEFYANYTEAYRPMLFADLTATPTTDVLDANMKDASGFSLDAGYRGRVKDWLFFDANAFYMDYRNRIGTLVQQRTDNSFYNYRTNIGASTSKGVEAMVEFSPTRAFLKHRRYGNITLSISYAYTDARYGSFPVITKNGNQLTETNLRNKRVENAPLHILRSGLTWAWKGASITAQVSYVSDAYADANNTEKPTANAQNGLIPAYTVSDLSASCKINQQIQLKGGINNLANARYFTRRAGGYPGPGLMPSDARSVYLSVGAKL